MVITARDRIADVLARDEALVEVLIATSAHFARLRNRTLRRAMARLVTVEQAARIAGVDPDLLLGRLNAALGHPAATPPGVPPAPGPARPEPGAPAVPAEEARMPGFLTEIGAGRTVDLDVRDDLRAGREPFGRIMAGVRALPAGGVLRLRTTFEPVPLYQVLGQRGLGHWTERLAADDWRVWFFPAGAASAEPAPGGDPRQRDGADATPTGVVVLDVRGLEPPEPMVRTLAALEALPPGGTLLQRNTREPRFLLPQLRQMGFTYEVRERGPEDVEVLIRRTAG
jgi:uncharacterized protein (DUF2249 family)